MFQTRTYLKKRISTEPEISKSKAARKRRRENGGREGTPPTGLDWDDDRHGWVPDDDFESVLRILALKDERYIHREIVSEIDVAGSTGTVTNILNGCVESPYGGEVGR